MHKRNHKRGVSPLIATVLLIAFAVALGAVVMNWGRSYTEQTAASVKEKGDVDVKCSLNVKMKVIEFGGTPQFCSGQWGADSYINFTITNSGDKKIELVKLQIFGESGIFTNLSVPNSTMEKSGAAKLSAKYPYSNTGNLKKVIVIPVVEINGKQTECSESGQTIERDVSDVINCNST